MQYESPAGGADLGSYVDPDPSTGTDGSIVRAPAIENAMRELHYLIEQGGLVPNRSVLTQVYQAVLNLIANESRKQVLVTPAYYVSPSGSNSNPGTIGSPFLTIQKAVDELVKIDFNGLVPAIQLADGTYTSPTVIPHLTGGGVLSIQGNAGAPGNVIISTTGAHAFTCNDRARVSFSGLEVRTAGGAYTGILVQDYAVATVSGVRFGACQQYHIQITHHGQAFCSNYSIVGSANGHWYAANFGYTQVGGTITLTGTPNFSGAFVQAAKQGQVSCTSGEVTFSGSATGKRYSVGQLGLIFTGAAGPNFFPGNVAGDPPADGGIYQ